MTSLIDSIKIEIELKGNEIKRWEENMCNTNLLGVIDGYKEMISQNKGYITACEDIIKLIGG
tara:strand:+ start:1786 stop:1971 length:186 start_codon:yes stop_codon:yes gene_type:complete